MGTVSVVKMFSPHFAGRGASAILDVMADPTRKKRPRDPSQLGKLIVDISVGEVEDREPATKGRLGGLKGGPARARVLSKSERVRIAKKAAKVRWKAGAAAGKREPSKTES